MKAYYILILYYLAYCSCAFAQKSPVQFLNNTYTVVIDTTSSNNFYSFSKLDLTYVFKNYGDHVVFIDSFPAKGMTNHYITKPGAITNMHFSYSNFFGFSAGGIKRNDCSATLSLPFYYEGHNYTEEIKCNILYGKGNLITVDTLNFDLTEKVKSFVLEKVDTANNLYPNLELIVLFTVRNNTDKVISCTKDMRCFYDNNTYNYTYKYIDLKPGETYQIPLTLYMAKKFYFKKSSFFIVQSEGISEVYTFSVVSKYKKK